MTYRELGEFSNELSPGQIVKSKAGRDKDRVFLVSEVVDDQYVLIVDGKLRKWNSPKKKKVKHLQKFNTVVSDYPELIKSREWNDAKIRNILKPFGTKKGDLNG